MHEHVLPRGMPHAPTSLVAVRLKPKQDIIVVAEGSVSSLLVIASHTEIPTRVSNHHITLGAGRPGVRSGPLRGLSSGKTSLTPGLGLSQ